MSSRIWEAVADPRGAGHGGPDGVHLVADAVGAEHVDVDGIAVERAGGLDDGGGLPDADGAVDEAAAAGADRDGDGERDAIDDAGGDVAAWPDRQPGGDEQDCR